MAENNNILSELDRIFFRKKLIVWHKTIDRPMPWKETKDPYKIWLSEVILQQTRVDQGWDYYLKFIDRFPTIQDLAKASEDEVLKLWQGLGYYSRARNLHYSAKYVVSDFNGVFPDKYEDILSLKGVGKYTAAAISSFAYELPFAVVDGNVIRVLARYFGISDPVDSSSVLSQISSLAQELLLIDDPSLYNQAIIDFGALHCTPKKAKCDSCPLNSRCISFQEGLVDQIPFKQKKIKKRNRYFNYFIIRDEKNKIVIIKRTDSDIWSGLYEFPLVESKENLSLDAVYKALQSSKHIEVPDEISLKQLNVKPIKHVLSHQNIYSTFYELDDTSTVLGKGHFFVSFDKLRDDYAVPVLISKFLEGYT